MARKIVLRSPLPPVPLATKLRQVLGDSDDRPTAGVTGQGSDQDMTLYVYRPNFQNSFQTGLKATMDADGGGTRIDGRIGPPASATFFMIFWFGFLGLFVFGAGAAMIAHGQSPLTNPTLFMIPLGMMVFGWGLIALGTWNDKKDQDAILKFLADTVQAQEA